MSFLWTADTSVTFSISIDTLNGKVDEDSLKTSIVDSAITKALDTSNFGRDGDTFTVGFLDILTLSSKNLLQTIVGAHTGTPSVVPQEVSVVASQILKTESYPRRMSESSAITISSHDYTEPTTWYQQSTLATSQTATHVSGYTNYNLPHDTIVNIDDRALTCSDNYLLLPDAVEPNPGGVCPYCGRTGTHCWCSRGLYRLVLYINGVKYELSDSPDFEVDRHHIKYTFDGNREVIVDHDHGKLEFLTPLLDTDVVTADYHWVNVLAPYASSFRLRPYKAEFLLEKTEIQFSQTLEIQDTVFFEVWGGSEEAHYALTHTPSMRPYMCGFRQGYRSAFDYMSISNKGTGTIQPFGGSTRGTGQATTVLPFDFAKASILDSDAFMTLQCYFENNKPYLGADFACLTFWIIETKKV